MSRTCLCYKRDAGGACVFISVRGFVCSLISIKKWMCVCDCSEKHC